MAVKWLALRGPFTAGSWQALNGRQMATLKRAICDKKWLAMLPFLPFVALTETINGPFMSCLLGWAWMEVRHIPQDLHGGIMGLLRCWGAIIVTWMEVIHEMDGSETSDGVETGHGWTWEVHFVKWMKVICDLDGGEKIHGWRWYKDLQTWMQVRQNLDEDETYRYLGGGDTQPGWKWDRTRKGLRCKSRGLGWSWDWTLVDLSCTPRELTECDMWYGWRWGGTGIAMIWELLTWMQVRQDLDGDEADQYGFEIGHGCSWAAFFRTWIEVRRHRDGREMQISEPGLRWDMPWMKLRLWYVWVLVWRWDVNMGSWIELRCNLDGGEMQSYGPWWRWFMDEGETRILWPEFRWAGPG